MKVTQGQPLQSQLLKSKSKDLQSKSNDVQKPQVKAYVNEVKRVKISKNDPNDPTVATKVLDSLDVGFVNFSTEERETIAKILNNKAMEAKERIKSRSENT